MQIKGGSVSMILCFEPSPSLCTGWSNLIWFCETISSGKWMWQPTPIFLAEKFHGKRSLVGYSTWGYKESDMTSDWAHTHAPWSKIFFSFFLEHLSQLYLFVRGGGQFCSLFNFLLSFPLDYNLLPYVSSTVPTTGQTLSKYFLNELIMNE